MNIINELYRKLPKDKRYQYRKRICELFEWRTDKTFYLKLREEHNVTPIERVAVEMVYDEINNTL